MDEDYEETSTAPMHAEDKEQAMVLAKYILSSEIPAKEKVNYEKVQMMFNKEFPLSNIRREDIPHYQTQLKIVFLALQYGEIEYAREIMALVNQELKLTRGVDGLQLRLGVMGVQRTESVQRIQAQQQQKGFRHRLGSFLRKDKGGEQE